MTLTLELTEDEQSRLKRKAGRVGLDEEAFMRMLINEEPAPLVTLPGTPAEAAAMWEREGLVATFSDRPDSPAFARQFREQAGRRNWG